MKPHLPKGLFTAVMALFAVSQTTWAGEIWVNFGCDSVTSSVVPDGSGMPTGDKWNNITSANNSGTASGSYTLTNTDGAEAAQLTLQLTASSWGESTHNDNVLTQMQSSYLDVNGTATWTMSLVSDIYSEINTLTLYFSGDGGTYDPVAVNGTTYIGGTDTTGDTNWGNRQYSTTMDANNTIILNDVGAFHVNMGDVDKGGRATISGMSVNYSSDDYYAANLASGNNAASELTYQLNGSEDTTAAWADITTGGHYLVLDGAEDDTSVYTISSDTTIKGIQANSNTVTLASDGVVTVNKLWAKTDSTLKVTATLQENSDVQIGGAGQVEMCTSQNLGNLTLMGNLNISADTTVSLSGVSSVIQYGATLSGDGKLSVMEDVVLTIDSMQTNLMGILSHTEGNGTINIMGGGEAVLSGANNHTAADQALKDTPSMNSTTFSGVISMAADTKLVIGEKSTGSYTHFGWAVGLDDATIAINGGGLRFNGHYSTIGTLDVNDTDTVHIQDTYSENGTALTVKTLNLDANLTLTSTWKAVLDIEKLQGTGDLTIADNSQNKTWKINIGSIASSGAIAINEENAVVTLGADGESILNLGGNITNSGTLNIKGELTGTSTISGGTINLEDTVSIGGDITFGSDIHIAGTLFNTGNLTLNNNVTYDGDISTLTSTGVNSYSIGDTDGYLLGGEFYVVESTGTASQASLGAEGLKLNGTYDLVAKDGSIIVSISNTTGIGEGTFYLNTMNHTIDGLDTNASKDATGYHIAAGQTLTIAANQSESMTAGQILGSATGEGNITLTTNATIADNVATQAKGTLTIENVTLTVGNGSNNRANVSSFSAVTLKGGTLDLNGADQEVQNLTIDTAKSTLSIRNASKGHQTYTLTGTTTLNADLDVIPAKTDNNSEHGTLVVKELTGTGNLHASGGTATWGATILKLEKLTNYSGEVSVDSHSRTSDINYVEFGTSDGGAAFASLEGLTLSNNAYALVHAKADSTIKDVVLNNGTLKYCTDYGSYNYTLNEVTVSGTSTIEIDGSNKWHEGNVKIKDLQNATGSTGGTLILKSDFRNNQANTFNLDGGAFAGTIELQAAEGGDVDRPHALNINHASVAQNAEIKLTNSNSDRNHNIALGIGAPKVTIKGLSGGTANSAVYSGAQTFQTTTFASDETTRTLEIATDDKEYTANIAVKGGINIKKSGNGTQTISGDQSAMNGTLEASAGTLNITNTGSNAMNLAAVKATGGIVQVNDANNPVTMTDMTISGAGQVKGDSMTVTGTMTISKSSAFDLTGALTFGTNATVDLSGFDLSTYTIDGEVHSFTLGTANGGITATDVNNISFSGFNVKGYTAVLQALAANPAEEAVMMTDGAATNNYLVLTLTKVEESTPLTSITVAEDGHRYADGVLTLKTDVVAATEVVFGDTLNAVMSDEVWDSIKENIIASTLPEFIKVSFADAAGELLDFGNDGPSSMAITINGEGTRDENWELVPPTLSGGGTVVGNYVTAYIPEPTTTTLSLLALAGLAARRRRATR